MSHRSFTHRRRLPPRLVGMALVLLLLPGCTGLYFRDVRAPLEPPRYTLQAWPYQGYWTGIIFNGEKIGLTHLAMVQGEERGSGFELRSEALLAFRFLGLTKRVTLKAQDWVSEDLRLLRFVYDFDLDGSRLHLAGLVEGDHLVVDRVTGGKASREVLPVPQGHPVYPTSALALYPTLHGLAVGRAYRYLVYDGQRQELASVIQTITAYQESDLYDGHAFEIQTSMGGQDSTTWINDRGEPVLEMAWHGLLISTLETERQAKSYLARASVNKSEVLLEYSRVRTNVPVARPREVTAMQVAVQGMPPSFRLPSDRLQECRMEPSGSRVQAVCQIHAADPALTNHPGQVPDTDLTRYLTPTPAIQNDDPKIQNRAREIVTDIEDPIPRVKKLVAWLQDQVTQTPVDVFSALDVLEGRKAECQGLTWLYASFARSLGIPTRVTNGLVYSEELAGFFYHTWAESYVQGAWLPVDPTFGQVGVDATHLKLLDGDRPADLLPLVDLVGKIRVEVLSVEPAS